MTTQFKEEFTFRDGGSVVVQVDYTQGSANKMTEKKALEQAAEMIASKLGELGEDE